MRTNNSAFLFCMTALLSLPEPGLKAQERQPWQFPPELRQELDARVKLFVAAQAAGRWDEVAEMLGDYRRGSTIGYKTYTPAHKACLVSQMRKLPMIGFEYTVQESPYSSEIIFTSPDRRWWTLAGKGLFQRESVSMQQESWLIAYRDKDQWFFSPSNFDDNASARAQYTDEELARDRKDQVEIQTPAGSPLDVVDLHVHVDPQDLQYRRIQFRLRNRTSVRITGYGYTITDSRDGRQEGSISMGTGKVEDAIPAGGVSREFKEISLAYIWWCEGEATDRITIDNAHFEDGRDWNASKK